MVPLEDKLSKENLIELGDKVKDKISGFEGIAVGRTKWIHGCDRINVAQMGLGKDGEPGKTYSFDEAQLNITQKQAYAFDEADRPQLALAANAAPEQAQAAPLPRPGGPHDAAERRPDVSRD